MKNLLRSADRDELRRRVAGLRPDTPARWGSFTAPGMLSHLIQSLRVTAGEVPMPPEPTPWVVRHAPLRHLLIYVLPFPKGLATSAVLLERAVPEASALDEAGWAGELRAFEDLLDVIGARDPSGAWPVHAAFGRMSAREWGVLQARHIDHHFRQFGI